MEFNVSSNTIVTIPSGVHYIEKPIIVSGENIRITGEDGAVLCGAISLTRKDFTETEPGVFCAEVPGRADGLYLKSEKYIMARYPKYSDPDAIFGGSSADCTKPEKVKNWKNPTGGYLHGMHRIMWGGFSFEIDGKTEQNELIYHGGWQNNRQSGLHENYRFVENIREEMTEPGEWFYSVKEQKIYVRPRREEDLEKAEVILSHGFFIFENCKNVTVENLAFRYGSRTFMETKEPLLRSDWTICRKGAVVFRNCTDCTVDRCNFYDIGSNGVFVDGNCSHVAITRTHFSEIGASAVCFVGRSSSVRSPLFEFNERQAAADMDKTPGPKSDEYPKNCSVEDCLIERVGTTEKQATGVEISISYGITVKNCTIRNTSRSGINISEGTFGGHRIEGCDVFDTVRETGDHGSFNSWGRDRFWHLTDTEDADCGRYADLDMLAPNVITRNRFRCDRGWDIDLDDGSSNYIITENLCLHGGLKLREGFRRVVRNNIINDTLHCHVWYENSEDLAENNIIMKPYPKPIMMPEKWGRVDNNILHTPGQSEKVPAEILKSITGQDDHSVCLDCDFTAPEKSDYRPRNPLLTGFENFPTEFGVRYTPLKALAKTPALPKIETQSSKDQAERVRTLAGAVLRNIESDGDMTVYGTEGRNGVLVLSVEGAAKERGIQPHDTIVQYGGQPVQNLDDLSADTDWKKENLVVLRKQTRTLL